MLEHFLYPLHDLREDDADMETYYPRMVHWSPTNPTLYYETYGYDRESRALDMFFSNIPATIQHVRRDGVVLFKVGSQRSEFEGPYLVSWNLQHDDFKCTCPDYRTRTDFCKHILYLQTFTSKFRDPRVRQQLMRNMVLPVEDVYPEATRLFWNRNRLLSSEDDDDIEEEEENVNNIAFDEDDEMQVDRPDDK